MFPFRTSSIFRSRWMALLWAAGICWSAAQFVGGEAADDGVNASGNSAVDVAPLGADQFRQTEGLLKQLEATH